MSVSRERVFEIADQLDSSGINPTLAAVRKALGSGSYSTISPLLAEWRTQRTTTTRTVSDPPPQTVIDQVNTFGAELWASTLEVAHLRFTADREALDTRRSQIEAELKETIELADHYFAELEAAKNQVAVLEISVSEAHNEVESMRKQVEESTQRVATAEAMAVEREKRAEDLHAALDRVSIQNNELVMALTSAAAGREISP